jgi:hypothetical protein
MNAETIKDFVSLGFKVDESGERKFNAVLAGLLLTPLNRVRRRGGGALCYRLYGKNSPCI